MGSEPIKKILLIDDDPFILEMYVLKLKEHNFQIETASNGKEGLAKIREFKPDLLLLDIVMPALDGFDILREIKKNPPPNMKIILLTNLGQKEDVERGMQLGADDYIIKAHFTPSEVVEKVKGLLKE